MAQRKLSANELKAIKKYNLLPYIEQKVCDVWSMEAGPKETHFLKDLVIKSLSLALVFGSTILIWVNYFTPDIMHMQGVLNFVRFSFWILFPLGSVIKIFQAVLINKDNRRAFQKFALDCWYKEEGFFRGIKLINTFALIVGFVFNGFFFTAIISAIFWSIMLFVNAGIRVDVQKNMDEITPVQNGSVIDADYTVCN